MFAIGNHKLMKRFVRQKKLSKGLHFKRKMQTVSV